MRQLNNTETHLIQKIINNLNWIFDIINCHNPEELDNPEEELYYSIKTNEQKNGIIFTIEYKEEITDPTYTIHANYKLLAITKYEVYEVYTLEDVATTMAKIVAEIAAKDETKA